MQAKAIAIAGNLQWHSGFITAIIVLGACWFVYEAFKVFIPTMLERIKNNGSDNPQPQHNVDEELVTGASIALESLGYTRAEAAARMGAVCELYPDTDNLQTLVELALSHQQDGI